MAPTFGFLSVYVKIVTAVPDILKEGLPSGRPISHLERYRSLFGTKNFDNAFSSTGVDT